jgi:hypothetical protein
MDDDFNLDDLGYSPRPPRRRQKVRMISSPKPEETVYIHPNKEFWQKALVVKHKSRLYLVIREAREKLDPVLKEATLIAAAQGNGDLFIWPARDKAAVTAANQGSGKWCEYRWNLDDRTYVVSESSAGGKQPEWPDDALPLLKQCFGERVIKSADDPLVAEILKSHEK